MAAEDSREAVGQQGEDSSLFTESFNRLSVNEDGNRLGPDGEPAPRTDEEYAQAQLTLRAIVSSKEAGIIIGKAGKNVADLRDETGVKAGVSKVVQGVHDRVLTVTGGLEGIAKAYAIVSKGLLEGAPQMGMGGVTANGTHRKLTLVLESFSSQDSSPLLPANSCLLLRPTAIQFSIEAYSRLLACLNVSLILCLQVFNFPLPRFIIESSTNHSSQLFGS
jgi:hypothetical protein